MNEKEYRQHPAISRSQLFKILDSPEKFKYAMEHPEEPTPALLFGQLFHCMALQPEKVGEQFAIAPNIDRRTKAGKEAYAQFIQQSEDKTVVTEDMALQAQAMCESLYRNDFARKLLAGEKEKPFFWVDDLTGEECKCRVDCLTEVKDSCIIVDVKSTDNAETDAFIRAAVKYGYDFQSAMYTEGIKKCTGKDALFVFIAVEKSPPYSINILQADKIFLQRGYDIFRQCIGTYHDCKVSGNWWGYLGKFNQINNLSLPAYLAKEVE